MSGIDSTVTSSLPSVSLTIPPNHILQDGTFGHVGELTSAEHVRFFERSVARHGLLDQDLQDGGVPDEAKEEDLPESHEETKDSSDKEKSTEPKIHPLALASARLQSNAMNELNRAINLHSLAANTDYFGLTNIIDPNTSDTTTSSSTGQSASLTPAAALYRLQRHRRVLQSTQFRACRRRSQAALAISCDDRCRRLRSSYRFTSPEHPTHHQTAAKPTETVAVDLHVYKSRAPLGRLARGVPRYAVIELEPRMSAVEKQALIRAWKKRNLDDDSDDDDAMEVDGEESKEKEDETTKPPCVRTKAIPYAVADPSLGKAGTDFDPSTVNMLTLQFDILKLSTGFVQSSCLEPIGTGTSSDADESVLVSLQHSLFCANLFESMRRELAADTETVGALHTGLQQQQQAVWLSGESDEHFLPSPLQMIGSDMPGLAAMCVVHVHEGDIQVLLDAEYALRVRLVEPQSQAANKEAAAKDTAATSSDSGSQSATQLLTLCKALLWHGQQLYHDHSKAVAAEVADDDTTAKQKVVQDGHARRATPSKETGASSPTDSPCILQRCVSLFNKILLERQIRAVLRKVASSEAVQIEWMAISVWELTSHCVLRVGEATLDISIATDTITAVTNDRRKAHFRSAVELDLCIKNWIRRCRKATTPTN